MTSSGVAHTVFEAPDSVGDSTFAELRPRLFSIAYRSVGDVREAEDIVQETWIRWRNCDRGTVRDARAFLATATARLSSNAVQSARARHETYVDTWLPEPPDATADPALVAERGEAIEFAMRLMLEKLSPNERAAYVLRHAFDYPYARIAEIIEQTQASVRQHISRARKRLTGRQRVAISAGEHQQLLGAFVAGAQDGDLIALEQLFAADSLQGRGRCGPGQIDASRIHGTPTRSHGALAPGKGVHKLRDGTRAKPAATERQACLRSGPDNLAPHIRSRHTQFGKEPGT
jgi:RNA polymerase sigma-70 factor (ECF subfamily)